jgi:hypothetical protein
MEAVKQLTDALRQQQQRNSFMNNVDVLENLQKLVLQNDIESLESNLKAKSLEHQLDHVAIRELTTLAEYSDLLHMYECMKSQYMSLLMELTKPESHVQRYVSEHKLLRRVHNLTNELIELQSSSSKSSSKASESNQATGDRDLQVMKLEQDKVIVELNVKLSQQEAELVQLRLLVSQLSDKMDDNKFHGARVSSSLNDKRVEQWKLLAERYEQQIRSLESIIVEQQQPSDTFTNASKRNDSTSSTLGSPKSRTATSSKPRHNQSHSQSSNSHSHSHQSQIIHLHQDLLSSELQLAAMKADHDDLIKSNKQLMSSVGTYAKSESQLKTKVLELEMELKSVSENADSTRKELKGQELEYKIELQKKSNEMVILEQRISEWEEKCHKRETEITELQNLCKTIEQTRDDRESELRLLERNVLEKQDEYLRNRRNEIQEIEDKWKQQVDTERMKFNTLNDAYNTMKQSIA